MSTTIQSPNGLKIGQAVFTSNDHGSVQVIGHSCGVAKHQVSAAKGIIPNCWDLVSLTREALCCLWSDETFLLVRSFAPTMELDEQKNIMSIAMWATRENLDGFSGNVATFLTVAKAYGALRLSIKNLVDDIEMPGWSLLKPRPSERANFERESKDIARAIEIHGHVALIGLADPLRYLENTLAVLHRHGQDQVSFSIGLKASPKRKVNLNIYDSLDESSQLALGEMNVRKIKL